MDDTSRHTGRMVNSACASQAVHQLLLRNNFKHDSASTSSASSPSTSFVEVVHEDGADVDDSPDSSPNDDGNAGAPPQAVVDEGGGGGKEEGADAGDEKGMLDEVLPFYLHVSGWLDASANASVMAFSTLPCRLVGSG